jgi:hypothetical protein
MLVMDTGGRYGCRNHQPHFRALYTTKEQERDRTGPVNRLWHCETERGSISVTANPRHGLPDLLQVDEELEVVPAKSTSRAASGTGTVPWWKMKS